MIQEIFVRLQAAHWMAGEFWLRDSLLFCALLAASQVLLVPVTPFAIFAGFVLGFPKAFLLLFIAKLLSATLNFTLSRYAERAANTLCHPQLRLRDHRAQSGHFSRHGRNRDSASHSSFLWLGCVLSGGRASPQRRNVIAFPMANRPLCQQPSGFPLAGPHCLQEGHAKAQGPPNLVGSLVFPVGVFSLIADEPGSHPQMAQISADVFRISVHP